jgi:integrase
VCQRLVAYNVFTDIDRPRREATNITVWSAPDLAAFLAHAAYDRLAPRLRLASHTGARRSELLGLRWSHVDLAAAMISIARRRTRVEYTMVACARRHEDGRRRRRDRPRPGVCPRFG